MRSTDRDLLVAQQVLSQIKWPNRKELAEKARLRDAEKLKNRVVQMSFNGVLANVSPTAETHGLFDLKITFEVKHIPFDGQMYTARVNFQAPAIYGAGKHGKEKELDAKETFRKFIANGIREEGSALREGFFANVEVFEQTDSGNPRTSPVPNQAHDAVAEKFRVWIGQCLRKVDGKIRTSFFSKCKATERQLGTTARNGGSRSRKTG